MYLVSSYLPQFQNPVCANPSESIATLPPFCPIEGHKWFDQISNQWESQKNRFAFEISRSCRIAFEYEPLALLQYKMVYGVW
jgi:hypothetical protein